MRSGGSADAPKSSAYKGVSWHKHSQKWYAYIQAGGKMRGLGYFDSQEDAARAYDAEARKVRTHRPFFTHSVHQKETEEWLEGTFLTPSSPEDPFLRSRAFVASLGMDLSESVWLLGKVVPAWFVPWT